MSEGILLLVDVIVCVFLVLAPLPSNDFIDPKTPQGKYIRRTEIRLALTILVIAGCSFLSISAFGKSANWLIPGYLTALTAIALILLHPWLLAKLIFIPLGFVRFSYRISSFGGFPWNRDPQGGAVLAGTLALLRKSRPKQAEINWLEAKLRLTPLGGAGIVAAGLLAAIRGDLKTARIFLQSIELLDSALCPPIAQRIAVTWCMLDAASLADWPQLIQLGQQATESSRLLRFLVVVAKRLTGEPIQRRWILLYWLWAPHRRHTFSLFLKTWRLIPHQNLQYPKVSEDEDLKQVAANDGGLYYLHAFSLHAEVLKLPQSQLSEAVMIRLAQVWDETFADQRLSHYLSERVLKLKSSLATDEIAAKLQQHVIENLAINIREYHLPWQTIAIAKQGLLQQLKAELTKQSTQAIEQLIQMISQRLPEKNQERSTIYLISEWQFWLTVREQYTEFTNYGGIYLRACIFPTFEQAMSQYALCLWNQWKEKALAELIFAWLLAEAEALGCWQSAKIYRYNLVVGF